MFLEEIEEAAVVTMDLDSPWDFDRLASFLPSPSPSERPWSPLWSFSDNMSIRFSPPPPSTSQPLISPSIRVRNYRTSFSPPPPSTSQPLISPSIRVRNYQTSFSPPPPSTSQPLISPFNQETLQHRIQALIEGAHQINEKTFQHRLQAVIEETHQTWTYAIFWESSDSAAPAVIGWGNGYYNGEENNITRNSTFTSAAEQEHRKSVLRELCSLISQASPDDAVDEEEVTDTEWFFLVSMTQTFGTGNGLPGQAFYNSKQVWVAGPERLAESQCERARQALSLGLQTIVCIPMTNGVLELGATDVIYHSSDLMNKEYPSNEDMAVFSALPCFDERVSLMDEESDNEVCVEVLESSARNIVETTTVLIPPITEISQNERQVDTVASEQNEDMAVFSAEHNEADLPCLDERVSLTEEERDSEVRVEVPESSARHIVETATALNPRITEISQNERQVDTVASEQNGEPNIVEIPPITEISQNERQVDTVASEQKGDPKSSSQRVYRTGTLSSKDIEQHFGKKLEDAAKNLGVGVSTLKRACRANGIARWPSSKRNKTKSSPSKINHRFDKHDKNVEPSSSNPRPMYTTGVANKSYDSPRRWVTVKATCGDDMIRFRLSTSSFTMADLLGNITQRLQLTVGSFKIKYEDDNGDWILIACDDDIEECIRLLNDENSIINMSLVML